MLQHISDARLLSLLLRYGTTFRSEFPASPFEVRIMRGGTLFQYLRVLQEGDDQLRGQPNVSSDIQLLSKDGADSNTRDFSCFWNFAMYASGLPGRLQYFEDPRQQLGLPISLVSIVCWASPTAQCCCDTLDCIAPVGSNGYTKYAGELIQAALYRQDRKFLYGVLRRLNVKRKRRKETDLETTDKFVNLLKGYLRPIKKLAGSYSLLWTSLKRKNLELFDATMKLDIGKTPGFEKLLELVLDDKDAEACHFLLSNSTPLKRYGNLPSRLVLRAIARRFPEGLDSVLSLHRDKIYPGWIIPALLTFNAEIIHCLREHSCLVANIDSGFRKMRGSWIGVGTFVLAADGVSKYYRRGKIQRYITKGSPHLPLHLAVYLGCDPCVVTDLISAGALVMRKPSSAEWRPQVIRHIQKCVSVERAREVFYETLTQFQEILTVYGHRLSVRLPLATQTTKVAAALIGMDLREPNAEDVESDLDQEPELKYSPRSVALPKSLETDETWTSWRKEVYPILKKAHASQRGEDYRETMEAEDPDFKESNEEDSDKDDPSIGWSKQELHREKVSIEEDYVEEDSKDENSSDIEDLQTLT